MVRHLLIVATAFRVGGILIAVAALVTLGDLAETALVMRKSPPPDTSAPLDFGTYGLVGLISNAARGASHVMHALAGLASVLLVVLAVASVLALAFGVLLYLTGRGIIHLASWARISAIAMSAGLVLASCAIMAVMRRDHAPFAALPIALSLYTLWVMIWRFA
jgi:hypothetical protein